MNSIFWSTVGKRLLRVLRSRRVLLAVAGLVVSLLVVWLPELEAVQDELMTLIVTVLLAVIGNDSFREPLLPSDEPALDETSDQAAMMQDEWS